MGNDAGLTQPSDPILEESPHIFCMIPSLNLVRNARWSTVFGWERGSWKGGAGDWGVLTGQGLAIAAGCSTTLHTRTDRKDCVWSMNRIVSTIDDR